MEKSNLKLEKALICSHFHWPSRPQKTQDENYDNYEERRYMIKTAMKQYVGY